MEPSLPDQNPGSFHGTARIPGGKRRVLFPRTQSFLSEALLAFLRASGFDEAVAAERLAATGAWRAQRRLEAVSAVGGRRLRPERERPPQNCNSPQNFGPLFTRILVAWNWGDGRLLVGGTSTGRRVFFFGLRTEEQSLGDASAACLACLACRGLFSQIVLGAD